VIQAVRPSTLALALASLTSLNNPARAEGQPFRVLVMELKPDGEVPADAAETLTGFVASGLSAVPGLFVISADEVALIAELEGDEDFGECTQYRCLAEVAGALGVNAVVFGHVVRHPATWEVRLGLVDVASGELLEQVEARAESLEGARQALHPALSRLAGAALGPEAAQAIATADQGVTPSTPAVAPAARARVDDGISTLAWLGAATLGAGALLGALTGVGAWQLNEMVKASDTPRQAKDISMVSGQVLLLAGAPLSLLLVGTGALLAGIGVME